MLASWAITVAFAVVIYAITGSMLLAGVTGAIGGIAYSCGLRESA